MPLKLSAAQERLLYPFSRQSILILGAGREGLSTYQFLRQALPRKILAVADQNHSDSWSPAWREIIATDGNLRLYSGENYLAHLNKFETIFKTPGIPPTLPELQTWLEDPRHQLTSNTALFLQLCPGKTIGVTGTKGKSTTSSLIFHLLSQNNIPSVLLGNIGVPPLSFLQEITKKTAVIMELSAYQLQDLKISPHIAVVQNITSEHLDYYGSTKNYVAAKLPIVAYQKKQDFMIFNPDFPILKNFAHQTKATPLTFSLRDSDPEAVVFLKKQTVFYRDFSVDPPRLESVANLKQIKLKGTHNRQNILPAIIVAKLFKLDGHQINNALKTFSPLRHRLEWVAKIDHTDFYNDSLSTTPESMLAALAVFSKKQVILLAGGFERHQDYSSVAAYIAQHPDNVPEIILFPPTGARLEENIRTAAQKIAQKNFKNVSNTDKNKKIITEKISEKLADDVFLKKQQLRTPLFHHVETMNEAVAQAAAAASAYPAAVVLLSPGAASFGAFADYADRGDQFVANVKSLL